MTRPEGGAAVRVLFLVPDLKVGGAERHLVVTLPRLRDHGIAPTLCCLGPEGALFDDLAATGVPCRALELTKRDAPKMLARIRQAIREAGPDLIVCQGYNAETLGRIAARLHRVPSVVWIHSCSDLVAQGAVRRTANRLLASSTASFLTVAHAALDYARETYAAPAGKVRVIHNGIDPARFPVVEGGRPAGPVEELGIATEDLVVGILAVLRPEKNHAGFLRAARRVLEETPNARFLIAGDGPERPRLEQLAADLGIAERVIFAGMRSDLVDILATIDLSVLCSTAVECCPYSVLEAMAMARPVVGSAVGGVPELIADGETGRIVPVGDDAALAAAITGLLAEPAERQRMGEAGRARLLERFTLETAVAHSAAALLAAAA